MEYSIHKETKLVIGLDYQLKYKEEGARSLLRAPELGISVSCNTMKYVDDNIYKLGNKMAKAIVRYMVRKNKKKLKHFYHKSLKGYVYNKKETKNNHSTGWTLKESSRKPKYITICVCIVLEKEAYDKSWMGDRIFFNQEEEEEYKEQQRTGEKALKRYEREEALKRYEREKAKDNNTVKEGS